ncbi:hypothetical protein [Streptomyces sp. NPDC006334]|uniref:hypothetical protein n=1 Tax=Streptomyces sp. NPDC006334 TaxID=3156754 RepID=UPI0033B4DEA6
MPDGMTTRTYELRVAGQVPQDIAEMFPKLDTVVIGTQTVFYGAVMDEAHLFGLLARFQLCGLLITEMRPHPS